jgi:Retrotransposon gag protein
MTQDRRTQPTGSSTRPVSTNDQYQVPRADCPSFNGSNPIEWLRKCQSFFEMHQVPDSLRTQLATIQFQDRASEWYDGYLIDHDPLDWPQLVQLIRKRFNRIGTRNGIEELLDFHQSGSIEDYIEKFERLRSKLLLEIGYFLKLFFWTYSLEDLSLN